MMIIKYFYLFGKDWGGILAKEGMNQGKENINKASGKGKEIEEGMKVK